MKAWRVYGLNDMRLDEVPDPRTKPGWVLVKVKVVQVSGSEVRNFGGLRGPEARGALPIGHFEPHQRFGHEFSGEVIEVGEGVSGLRKDSRVAAADVIVPCGRCAYCRSGDERGCNDRHVVGDATIPGCLAEYAVIPARCLVELPDAVSDNEGACVQPLTSCISTVGAAGIELGDTVAVFGQGVIGLGIMQIARVSGAGRLIAIDPNDSKLALSKKLGADNVINARETSAVDAILELTQGRGVDIAFEAAGGSPAVGLSGTETLKQALRVVRPGGKVLDAAVPDESTEFRLSLFKERKYLPQFYECHSRKIVEHLVRLLGTKRIQVEPTITHRLNGLEAVPEAFEITGNKRKYGALNPAQVTVS